MPDLHLSDQELTSYRDRLLKPAELASSDRHLGTCEICRKRLAAITRLDPALTMLSDLYASTSDHLSFEQIEAYAENNLDQAQRAVVYAHLNSCEMCAREVRDFMGFAPRMSVPVLRAPAPAAAVPIAQERESFWSRLRSFFTPQVAILVTVGAAAAIVLGVLAPELHLFSPGSGGTVSTLRGDAEFNVLPESLRAGAVAIADENVAERPAALRDLPSGCDAGLVYPCGEVVEAQQPELRWNVTALSYSIELYDASHFRIAGVSNLSGTSWRIPQPLTRGALYSWELHVSGQPPRRAVFRVLGSSEETALEQARSSASGSHRVMGTVFESLGMLSAAQQEFAQMPNSADADRLRNNLESLRTTR